jgi:L-gulonolactone oxidase
MAIIRAPPASEPLDHLSVGDLEQLLDPVTTKSGKALTFRNWATTFRSDATAVFRPTSVQQVRYAVELARRQKRTIRAAGAGHSPSDIVCTGGYILDLKGLDKVIAVRPAQSDHPRVHASAAISRQTCWLTAAIFLFRQFLSR